MNSFAFAPWIWGLKTIHSAFPHSLFLGARRSVAMLPKVVWHASDRLQSIVGIHVCSGLGKINSSTPSPFSLDLILKLFCMQTWFIALRFSALLLQLLKLRNFHKHTETETDDRESTSSEREMFRAQYSSGVRKWCLNAKQMSSGQWNRYFTPLTDGLPFDFKGRFPLKALRAIFPVSGSV